MQENQITWDSQIMKEVVATARPGYKPSDLKLEDLQEVNFWVRTFENQIELACNEYPRGNFPETMEKLFSDVAEDFCHELKDNIIAELRDVIISIIDNYDE